ncbi:MAG: glycine cleavage system aminomethyltransferase GcvT [Bryobacterales bacterium]|nr:glycine cleavage system aminomethyltransferase GcvT [Bryobacterales bacterium]MBV9400029.1 glycine cleavage system aminomethyltransferase GcvT [Bryobacterales bacterium]
MSLASQLLRTTPLNEIHRRMGAKMVDFGGWDMPVQYSGIIEEHHAVRRRVGLFDVSHMGEIEIRGPEAGQLVDYVTTNGGSRLSPGQIQYSALLYEHGGFVDDILVHKVANDHYFLCVNASNQDKDYGHIAAHNRFNATVENAGERYAQLAVQGPLAWNTLQKLTPTDLAAIRYYGFTDGRISGAPARIARTGYTGEDGFEIYVPPAEAPRIWEDVLTAGAEFGILPCGLGARNTLRLEAKMALYGHEIDATTTPYEAGLGWIVKLDKESFIGRDALTKRKQHGPSRKLTGFEMRGRGIGRDGYEIYVEGSPAGWVTSGGPSPTLNKNIGLCYLPAARAQTGRNIGILVRGQAVDAVTVATPFYKRGR